MQDQPVPPNSSMEIRLSASASIRAELHRATAPDAAAVRDLVRAAYSKWVPLLGREPKPMTADYDAAVRDHVVDVLRLYGEMAALIELEPRSTTCLS